MAKLFSKLFSQNDSGLTDLNLNNVVNIEISTLIEFCGALKSNTTVETFSIANTKANDEVAVALAEMLKENKKLKTLNIETNFISTDGIVAILEPLK